MCGKQSFGSCEVDCRTSPAVSFVVILGKLMDSCGWQPTVLQSQPVQRDGQTRTVDNMIMELDKFQCSCKQSNGWSPSKPMKHISMVTHIFTYYCVHQKYAVAQLSRAMVKTATMGRGSHSPALNANFTLGACVSIVEEQRSGKEGRKKYK